MEFNSYVFPKPAPTYSCDDYKGEMVWIPKKPNYSYKEKIKYSSYKSLIPKNCNSTQTSMISTSSRLRSSHRSTSMIQKIPSISFTFENKFTEVKEKEKISYIPCLFLKLTEKGSNKIMLYFHANYEDLGNTYSLCSCISKNLKINVLSVEYPGYGVYQKDEYCTSAAILDDAETVYRFLNDVMGIEESNIIVMGRCVGSGPATYLAAKYNPMSLILLSAFKSIREAVKSIFDKMNFGWMLQKLVKERFNNYDTIEKIKCPILFIHGKRDDVIPWVHSLDLINKCTSPGKLVTPEYMTHNTFDLLKDVVFHIYEFVSAFSDESNDLENNSSDEDDEMENIIRFPLSMFSQP